MKSQIFRWAKLLDLQWGVQWPQTSVFGIELAFTQSSMVFHYFIVFRDGLPWREVQLWNSYSVLAICMNISFNKTSRLVSLYVGILWIRGKKTKPRKEHCNIIGSVWFWSDWTKSIPAGKYNFTETAFCQR